MAPMTAAWLIRTIALVSALSISAARAEEPALLLRLVHDAPLERGRAATVSLALSPAPGLRLLDDGPLVVELAGVAVDPTQRTLRRRDAVDPRADSPRFEIEVRAHKTGTPTLAAHVTAWVCRGRRCRAAEERVELPLELARATTKP